MMTAAGYQRIERLCRCTMHLPLLVAWGCLIWRPVFWLGLGGFVFSFLPYLLVYNTLVRGYLYRRIQPPPDDSASGRH
ncbi:hypothetical protein [Chitinilyticum piscinae]|uniref:Uncharacterized protein n=1 Tax=Chitinilyticum piscinae TaxID=2866724 RepID=A0A8J7FGA6_9NEIS|nr:hypothetical protein [Chitinilyticum piscinae]MBE9608560.1 hypothetical protein [Chitinilyticum piscinae]